MAANPKTFSPDPQHLDVGAGTAAAQTALPRQYADYTNGGYTDVAPLGATETAAPTPAPTKATKATASGA